MPKRITPVDPAQAGAPIPLRVVIVTMDSHLSGAAARARQALRRDYPGLDLVVHAADEWGGDDAALARCHQDIARGDIVIATVSEVVEQDLGDESVQEEQAAESAEGESEGSED